MLRIFWEVLFCFPLLAFKYRKFYRPGFSKLTTTLLQSFSTFCDEHNIKHIGLFAKTIITGYGYGYFDEVPAAYYLKHIRFSFLLDVLFVKKARLIPSGWQIIWEKISDQFEVIYNQEITKVTYGK